MSNIENNRVSPSGPPNRIDDLRNQISEVREIMTDNVERVLARGDRLEDLLDKSEELESTSSQFRNNAQKVQRHLCMKNAKWTIICTLVVLVVVTVIVLVALYETGILSKSSPQPTTQKPPPVILMSK